MNTLVVGLGLPALTYVAAALSTSLLSDRTAFIWLIVIGAVYWLVVEQHSAVRFAWLRRRDGSGPPPVLSGTRKFLLIAYNAVWWLPIALAMVGIVSARFAFLGFLAFSVFRAAVNLYRNNIMPVDQAELFPLRLP